MTNPDPRTLYRRRLALSTALAGGLLGLASSAGAQLPTPGDATVVAGSATISNPTATSLRVELDATRTIVNWTGFSVPAANSAGFFDCRGGTCTVQPGQIAVLNRVTGAGASQIMGTLTADPNVAVYLINPNGILFGTGANVNVGSLVASTLDFNLGDVDFLDGPPYNFTGVGTTGVTVDTGATLATSGTGGELVLVGSFFDLRTGSTLTASGDVAIAAASDISLSFGTGSPLSMTINQGTAVATPFVVDGTVDGRNVYVALATRATVLNALLDVGGQVTATTALATDRGVVLAAGASAGGVTIAGGGDTTGMVDLTVGGAVTATEAAAANTASVEARANDRLAIDADLTASDDVTAAGLTVAFGGGDIVATGGAATVSGPATISAATAVTAGTAVQFTGTVDGDMGAATEDLTVTSGAGATFSGAVGGVTPLDTLTVNGPTRLAGDVDVNTATFIGTLTLTGAGLRRVTAGSASFQAVNSETAGVTGLSVDAGGAVTFTSAIGGSGSLSGLAVRVNSASFTGTNFVGTLAADVEMGGLAFTNGQTLTIGLLDGVNGVDVMAGNVTLIAGAGLLLTSATLTAQNGNVLLTGPTTLSGASQVSAGGIGATVTFNDTVDGPGSLTTTSVAGTVFNDDVGAANTLGTLTVNGPSVLAGNVAANAVTFGGALTLRGAGLRRVTAGSASFQAVTSETPNATGLSVNVTGAAAFLAAAGSAANPLSGLVVKAHSAMFTGANFVGTLAADVEMGGLDFINGQTLTIGLLDGVNGVDVAMGNVTIATTGAASDLIVNAPVLASAENVGLTAQHDLTGSAAGTVTASGTGTVHLQAMTGSINLAGTVSGGGDVTAQAPGGITLGAVSGRDVALSAGGTLGTGSISASDDIVLRATTGAITTGALTSGTGADTDITGAGDTLVGALIVGGDIDALGVGVRVAGPARTTGTTSDIRLAGGATGIGHGSQDLDLGAGGSITLIGAARGLDIALSAGGSIAAEALSARDDIAVRAVGSLTAGVLASGATVDALGPAEANAAADALVLASLPGNDIDIVANGIRTGAVAATGMGSDVRLDGGAAGTGQASQDLDVRAGGNIQLINAARGRDVALKAEGTLGTGSISATDDIVLRATTGAIATGALTSGTGADTDVMGAGDTLANALLSGGDIDAVGNGVTVAGPARAASDIRLVGGATGIGMAAQDVDLGAGGNILLIGAARGRDVALSAGGTLGTDSIGASDDIVLRATTGAITTGPLTSGTGADTDITGAGDTLVSAFILGGDIDALGVGVRVAGPARAGSDIRLAGGAAGIGHGSQDLDLGAGGSITLSSAARGLDIALSAGGSIAAGALSARDDIAVRAVGSLTVGVLAIGATVDALGPGEENGVADALVGALPGNDIDIVANGIQLANAPIVATGAQSDVRIDGGAGGMGSGAQDLDVRAGGNIVLGGTARGLDIALNAGGAVTTAGLSARDDVAIRAATSIATGAVASGATVDALALAEFMGAADMLVGVDLPGHDIDLRAAAVSAVSATATGSDSDLRLRADSGQLTLGAGNVGGAATLVKLGTGAGELEVTGLLTSAGNATLQSATHARLGSVTSQAGAVLVEALAGEVTGAGAGARATLTALAGGGDVTVRSGTLARLGAVAAGRDISVTAGNVSVPLNGSVDIASAAGRDIVTTAVGGAVTIGTAAAGRDLTVAANNVELPAGANAVTVTAGNAVLITNRSAAGATRLGGATEGGGFTLTQAEINRISAGTVTIQSNARDIEIHALALADAVGSARLNLLTTGRIDVTGALAATQAANSRIVQIGGSAANAGQANVIAVDTSVGGRLLMGNSVLALRGRQIGVGQTDFLRDIGLNSTGTPISANAAAADYVGNAASRLYNPLAPNNADVVTAYQLSVTYDNYALLQNTAPGGASPRGAMIGAGGVTSALTLNSSGSGAANAFALFGRVNLREGREAAVLGPAVLVLNGASGNNSRINGCIINSSGGCLISAVTALPINVFDAAQANVLRIGEDLTLSFDPLVGSNNEALFGGLSSADPPGAEPDCESEPNDPRCSEPERSEQ